MKTRYPVIPAKAGIQKNKKDSDHFQKRTSCTRVPLLPCTTRSSNDHYLPKIKESSLLLPLLTRIFHKLCERKGSKPDEDKASGKLFRQHSTPYVVF